MSDTEAIGYVLAALAWGVAWMEHRGRKRAEAAAVHPDNIEAVERAVDGLSPTIVSLSADRDFQRRRADEFFEVIQGIERERDTWTRMWREGMHAAGVAQAWLSRDLGRTIKIANAYAKALRDKGVPASDVRADPRLDAILAQFEARRGADGPPKAPGMPAIETGQPEPSSERPAAQAEPGEFQGSS